MTTRTNWFAPRTEFELTGLTGAPPGPQRAAPPSPPPAIDPKAMATLIVDAGRMARGEIPAPVTAGPKNFVRMSAEEILAAARKARGGRP
jgi:hypothetical protein